MEIKRDNKIYKYTNLINGKVYIGQTCRGLESRARKDGCGYKGCPKFWNAIQKYGWCNFKGEILLENLSSEEACRLEEEYIRMYNSVENGYNVLYNSTTEYSKHYRTNVSDSMKSSLKNIQRIEKLKVSMKGEGNPFYGKHHTEETKEKIRSKKIGKHLTEEHKKKISKNNTRPFLGRKHKPESKEKMRNAHMGKHLTEEHKKKLSEVGKGRVIPEETRKRISNTHKKKGLYNAKPVLCIETGIMYRNMSEASRETGISRDRIRFSCKDPSRATDGLHWKFI